MRPETLSAERLANGMIRVYDLRTHTSGLFKADGSAYSVSSWCGGNLSPRQVVSLVRK